ncbi:MAG: DUF3187 family protein [Woeseia sp.]
MQTWHTIRPAGSGWQDVPLTPFGRASERREHIELQLTVAVTRIILLRKQAPSQFFCRIATFVLVACAMQTWQPAIAQPLHDGDNGPLAGLFGWPVSTEGSRLTAAGTNAWGLFASVSSHSVQEMRGAESLLLDGETRRLKIDYRRGFTDRFELGAEIAWVWHESGSLDSLISGWHDLFGLPQGNRDDAPDDQLLFHYIAPGSDPLELARNVNGIGDIRIGAAWLLQRNPGSSVALRAGIKLPTGDSAVLLGSGGTDLTLGLVGDVSRLWNIDSLQGHYRLHAIRLGRSDVLRNRTRRMVGQLSGGLGYRLSSKLEIMAQSTLRSASFDAEVAPLGDWSMSLTFGAIFETDRGLRVSLGVSEDIRVESTPDVTFLLGLSWQAH